MNISQLFWVTLQL